MDYPNSRITLKKNAKLYKSPFLYNKSGMELTFGQAILVQEKRAGISNVTNNETKSITEIFYNYGLTYKPSFQVSLIRKGSPAHFAGILEGDIILEVNGKPSYTMEMEEVIYMLSQKENRKIKVLVDRNGQHLRYEFVLKSLL